MFAIWEEVSQDFMGNGLIYSWELSFLTRDDLVRAQYHYDNLGGWLDDEWDYDAADEEFGVLDPDSDDVDCVDLLCTQYDY